MGQKQFVFIQSNTAIDCVALIRTFKGRVTLIKDVC